ncbi:serine/threonine-protein kinase [Geminocystis sp. NIES-3709]|uniref:serine/threonine-protein kinase n=1 Tax=Geminocystis sp. NIES-3709 TaxID=1617448 RepID=UPI0005FC4BDB|nr:serine/threonine-protein kinase [Geminocystis sp. NIES-3709]BAQ64633.1 serine/threonine kinase [Geminocystis sp. NIES-3709]
MSVIYCLNPHCDNPQNDTKTKKCRSCQSDLILHKRYVAIKKIGRGGFGTTYLAVDMAQKNQYCVVKQLELSANNPEAHRTALDLFAREAKTLAKLDHKQIPKLLDYFEENEQFYLIQDFVLGKDLEKEIKKGGIYQESSAKQFLRKMLPVLQYIHSQKVIHRDIKPGNILREKQTNQLYLIDFGAVKEQASTQLMNQNPQSAFTKISVGTMGFAPPEQLAMRPVYSSDVYALGATCIYLLTGKAPKDLCDNNTGELAWEKHTNVTANFAKVLNKMLELDVRKRFISADEVIKALDLVPYEQELAGGMVNLSSAKDTLNRDTITDEDDEVTIASSTSQNLAEAIRKRKEKQGSNTPPPKASNVLPPSQAKVQLTPEVIVQDYRQGNRNFSQQILSELDLQGLKLAGASFSQSKLIGVNLQKANLYRTNFYNANLAQANLKEANLQRAELYRANLKNADLQGADLTNANLTSAILREANLGGANLKGAKVDEEQLKSAKTNWRTVLPDGKRKWW